MSHDLVSLRMLVIAAAQPDQALWREATALAAIPIELETLDGAAAAAAVARRGADICVWMRICPMPTRPC